MTAILDAISPFIVQATPIAIIIAIVQMAKNAIKTTPLGSFFISGVVSIAVTILHPLLFSASHSIDQTVIFAEILTNWVQAMGIWSGGNTIVKHINKTSDVA